MTIREVLAVLKDDLIVNIVRVDESTLVSDPMTIRETYNKDFMDTEVISITIEHEVRDEGTELRTVLKTKLPPIQTLFFYKLDKKRYKRIYSNRNNNK